MFSWMKKKYHVATEQQSEPFEAELPNDDQEPGIDIYSTTWKCVKKEVESMLQAKRAFNDKPQDETKTALLRGDIRTLKRILELPNKQAESSRPGLLSRHNAGEEEL